MQELTIKQMVFCPKKKALFGIDICHLCKYEGCYIGAEVSNDGEPRLVCHYE